MAKIKDELSQQTSALELMARFYFHGKGSELLTSLPEGSMPFFTGMGTAADSSAVAAMHCRHLTLPALALEATEVGTLPPSLLSRYAPLVYVSGQGEDVEIATFLRKVEQGPLLAVTNNEASTLAQSANKVLLTQAGEESPLTARAYLNSLALLWLVCRRMASAWDGSEEELLKRAINRIQVLQQGKGSSLKAWHDVMDGMHNYIFTGQGPQFISARRGAAVMAGMARTPVQAVSLGSIRNGYVELSRPGVGVVIFANGEQGLAAELGLADELDHYGVNVLLLIDGMPRRIREEPPLPVGFDPFLATLLDAIAPQLWAIELAQALEGAGVRHRIKGRE